VSLSLLDTHDIPTLGLKPLSSTTWQTTLGRGRQNTGSDIKVPGGVVENCEFVLPQLTFRILSAKKLQIFR
jgi:hypothetical protein